MEHSETVSEELCRAKARTRVRYSGQDLSGVNYGRPGRIGSTAGPWDEGGPLRSKTSAFDASFIEAGYKALLPEYAGFD